MKKKSLFYLLYTFINTHCFPLLTFIAILVIWQGLTMKGFIPPYMLPSPIEVIKALIYDFANIKTHLYVTLYEAFLGLLISIVLSFLLSILIDNNKIFKKIVYTPLIITQTIPVVALAPLLVLWFGYDMTPKVILIIIVCFFPLTIGLVDGFKQADEDAISLLKAMGATKLQIFYHVKLPHALPLFLAALKVSVSYSVIGAVIAEWLGGSVGLGVYMTRMRKSFDFDNMFAVIIIIITISLLLMKLVNLLERKLLKWKDYEK